MVERIEYDRELKLKRAAELSLSLAKLPPRMQEYENRKKLETETGSLNERSKSMDRLFTFMPRKAKAVPDFKRLQKQFQQSLEEVKRQKNMSTTVPQPFTFHQPKSTAKMRRYLDAENQLIRPTMKERARSAVNIHSNRGGAGDAYSPVIQRDEK